jgi:TonB family protein
MPALYHDAAQRASDGAALTLTALLIAATLAVRPAMLWRELAAAHQSATQPSIELSLESLPIESRPLPAPPPPEPQVTHVRRAPKLLMAAPAAAPAETVLADAEATPEDAALIAASAPMSSPAAAPASHPDLDAQYAAGVRSDIDRRTHVPDSVRYRLSRPSGEVRVGFILSRAGEPRAVALRRSSGSAILDEAALSIVASGHYAAMPANVFTGEAEHEFAVTIEFRAASLAQRGP